MTARGYKNGVCQQTLDDVAWTPNNTNNSNLWWTLQPGGVNSLCLWQTAVLDYSSLLASGKTTAKIDTFITIFIYDLGGNGSNSFFEGVVVTAPGGKLNGGSKVLRLIR